MLSLLTGQFQASKVRGKLIPGLCFSLPWWVLITSLCEDETQSLGPLWSICSPVTCDVSPQPPLHSILFFFFPPWKIKSGAHVKNNHIMCCAGSNRS